MGIAKLLTLSGLLLPLHTLADRLMPARHGRSQPPRYVAARPAWSVGAPCVTKLNPRTGKALRVVRVVDTQAPDAAGRLVISGRLDEVCEELSRLAALENRDPTPVASRLH